MSYRIRIPKREDNEMEKVPLAEALCMERHLQTVAQREGMPARRSFAPARSTADAPGEPVAILLLTSHLSVQPAKLCLLRFFQNGDKNVNGLSWCAVSIAVLLATSAGAQSDEAKPREVDPSLVTLDPAPSATPPPSVAATSKPSAEEKKPTTEGKIGLLLQTWFWVTSDGRFATGSAAPAFTSPSTDSGGLSTFRIRRAEMSYDGKVASGRIAYRVMIDPAQLNGPLTTVRNNAVTVRDILQDANISYIAHPYVTITVGQFKIPLTLDAFSSSSKLDFAERTALGRNLGDVRELGLMLSSTKIPYFEYELAILNGGGKNNPDIAARKDGVGRVVVKPIKGLGIGMSGYAGATWDETAKTLIQKTRLGAELSFELEGFMLKAEYMKGRDGRPGAARAPAGYYVTGGYRVGAWQAVARYDVWDADTKVPDADCSIPEAGPPGSKAGSSSCGKGSTVALGINYDFEINDLHQAKIQLNYYLDKDKPHDKTANEVFLVGQVKY
jgi:phosphate-selective porin